MMKNSEMNADKKKFDRHYVTSPSQKLQQIDFLLEESATFL
jgi:hypothetical protein